MIENKLIEASAGTGKTQALGERLIELLTENIAPSEIVALTFSRAAAGEIFERFVSLLARKKDGADLLRRVLATQHLSQIGTLDSFLLRIVRAFPQESGLLGEIRMMDDYEAASERAHVSFSILRRTEANLKKAFVSAFSLAMNQEDVRSFVEAYRAFISSWHEYVTAQPDEASWGDPVTIWGRDPAFAHVTERELAAAADRVDTTFEGQDKWKDFAEWVRAFRGSFANTAGLTKKLLEHEDPFAGDTLEFNFSRKLYALTREETLVVRDALMCVYGYVIRQKLELARGVYKLISTFETEYARRIRSTGRIVFADVPRLIQSLPDEVRLALEYRTDSHIRAWAIDEFQDTSREQWKSIENLIDEAKQSHGEKSLFLVGDTKQAIYGWRNGDVTIFHRERDSRFYNIVKRSLTYRSGPAIVEAVNRVFAGGRIKEDFPAWDSPLHETAKPQLGGSVRVMDAPGRLMEDFVEPVRSALVAQLGEKITDPRRAGVTAAILVRGNDFGDFLANRLKAAGIEGVVWEGESDIFDTPALSGFLDLVQLADHPGDRLTYRHFILTPIARALYPQGVPEAGVVSRKAARSLTTRGLVRTFREIRARLPEDPREAWSVFTEERYTDMLRAAAEFELGLSAGTRLADFPRFLQGKKKRTVAEEGKIKVMTIHRSKGLGFDTVILPLYEHFALTREPSTPLVGEGWILPNPGSKVAKAVPELKTAYRERQDRVEQEALCLYYVAMTRAKRDMTLILHPPVKSPTERSIRFSDLVRSAALDDLGEKFARTTQPKTVGSPIQAEEHGEREPFARPPRTTFRRRLPSLQFQSGMSAGLLFTGEEGRRAALDRGTALHAQMEKVEFSPLLPKPEGFVELWRERAFEVFADGEWISGRFDRVTFFRRDGELHAEIVDFKSSISHPERYDAQLAAYRRAVAALTGLPLDRIEARLVQLPTSRTT